MAARKKAFVILMQFSLIFQQKAVTLFLDLDLHFTLMG